VIHQRRGLLSATASRDPPSPTERTMAFPEPTLPRTGVRRPLVPLAAPTSGRLKPRVTTTLCEAFLPARFGAGAHSVVSLSKGESSEAFACRLGNTELARVTVRTLAYTDASL